MEHDGTRVLLRVARHLHRPAPVAKRVHGSIDRGCLHSRRGLQAFEQLLKKFIAARHTGIALLVQRDSQSKQAVGANAEISRLYGEQCADHEAGADQ